MRKKAIMKSWQGMIFFLFLFGGAALLAAGCSFSYSSKSLFNSATSPSKSSSGSGDDEESYQADRLNYKDEVAVFTDSLARTKATPEDFLRGISRIAHRHGISDWESYKETYVAIGHGLRKAGIARKQLYTLPLLGAVMSPRPKMMKYILRGYDNS
jgi:hypothetical protein